MAQPAFDEFLDRGELQTAVIARQRDFDALFDGCTELRGVSYITSTRLLLDFMENRGFKKVEIVVGDSFTIQQLKEDLAHQERSFTEWIAAEVEAGALRVLVPKRTIHSKFFMLKNDEVARVIVTNADLSDTSRQYADQLRLVCRCSR